MARKAQGLSMNVIIIAALALLVLVILAIIFIGRMTKTQAGIDDCAGTCVEGSTDADCQDAMGSVYYGTSQGNCPESGQVCCVGVGGGA